MARAISKLAPGWWDYTTLDSEILNDAAALTAKDLEQLSRPGFKVCIYDTVEEFYTAEALEYIEAWQQATPDNPTGVCGPIGPTEHLPLVARIVNAIGLNLRDAHSGGWTNGSKMAKSSRPIIRFPSPSATARCVSTGSSRSCACPLRICTSRPAILRPSPAPSTKSNVC